MSTPSLASPRCSARTRTGLWDVANEMDQEDGQIWVYGLGDEGVMAFTDFGIDTPVDLIAMHKADPHLLKRSNESK
jgi:hypothetical protein